jgi:excisionase family DNA binding protein
MDEPGKKPEPPDDSQLLVVSIGQLRTVMREILGEFLTIKDNGLMDVEQVAEYLRQSPDWVYRHWKQLGGRKIGAKSIRFYRSDLDHWLKSRKVFP